MTVAELIAQLQTLNPHREVLIARGEWGPSRVNEVYLAEIRDTGGTVHLWEIGFPEIPDEDGDAPRLGVVVIR